MRLICRRRQALQSVAQPCFRTSQRRLPRGARASLVPLPPPPPPLGLNKLYLPSNRGAMTGHNRNSERGPNSLSQMMLQNEGFIHSPAPGTFTLLPMATRAFEKLVSLIDHQMKALNAQKIIMPSLTSASHWKRSGRWGQSAELFKLTDRNQLHFCLASTHEEAVTQLVTSNPGISEKHLPLCLYQITSKFRDEMKARSGLLRAREFTMKDLYTFDANEETATNTYKKISEHYMNLFQRLNLPVVKVEGSSGEMGGTFSHEYHLLSDVGEDEVFICSDCQHGFSSDLVLENGMDTKKCPKCGENKLEAKKGIEVGHSFFLGTRYTHPFDAYFLTREGSRELLQMGCHGLGVTRLIAASLEVLSDGNRMRWPQLIAPFAVALITPKAGSKEEMEIGVDFVSELALFLEKRFQVDTVLDDRTHLSIGRRLKECLIWGFPHIIVAGKRATESIPKLEVFSSDANESLCLTHAETIDYFRKMYAEVNWE